MPSGAFDFGYQRDAPAEPLLKRLRARQKPSWTPEARLAVEPDHARIRQTPSRQRRLAMVSRGGSRTLCQFLGFASEDVVHSKPACDLLGDIEAPCATRVQIHFLQDQEIGVLRSEKVDNFRQ